MTLNRIDTDSPEDRAMMTRKDIGLEMVRMKRLRPIMDVKSGVIYASMSEMARSFGVTPQTLGKKIRSQRTCHSYHYVDSYPPYMDIHACETVEEYISHYIRKYYFEFVQAMLPKMSLSAIKGYNNFRTSVGKPLVIVIDGDAIYDIYDDPDNPVFVCNVSDIGE